jgi:hypothetical protein
MQFHSFNGKEEVQLAATPWWTMAYYILNRKHIPIQNVRQGKR